MAFLLVLFAIVLVMTFVVRSYESRRVAQRLPVYIRKTRPTRRR